MANKLVRFGLKNVHYAPEDDDSFGAIGQLLGAVQMTTSPEGDSNTFYADDGAYFVTETNNGYSGTLEVAATDDAFLTAVLGYAKDATSGLTYEATDAQPTPVALMFEIDGNVERQRVVLYGVTFSRIETENNTKADSTEPDTVSLNFNAIGKAFTIGGANHTVVKAHCTDSEDQHEAYDSFFTKVPQPGTAATGVGA